MSEDCALRAFRGPSLATERARAGDMGEDTQALGPAVMWGLCGGLGGLQWDPERRLWEGRAQV